MSAPVDAVSAEQYALFAALRRGERLPPEVAWALTDLLTQVAVTVHQADTGQFDAATAGELRGWLDVLGRAQHKLTDEWGAHHG
ncbi:MAG TPA: hypothetical protein VGW74_04680 [Propionibacteriaceae bacterium]|nr:hypothetical protein [Propionibacteriaceae bacterium]